MVQEVGVPGKGNNVVAVVEGQSGEDPSGGPLAPNTASFIGPSFDGRPDTGPIGYIDKDDGSAASVTSPFWRLW